MAWSGRLGWAEWVELVQRVLGAPRWQRVFCALLSVVWLCWLVDQFRGGRSPLGLVRAGLVWADAPTAWLDAVRGWLAAPHRGTVVGIAAWTGGALWAIAHRRAVLPAALGWLVVLTVADALGYPGASSRAVLAFVVVVGLLLLLSVPWRRRPVVRRARLLPRDVFLAAGRAAAIVVLIPLSAPLLALTTLSGPYLTRPPQPDPTGIPLPRRQDSTQRPTQRE
ncbi:hypothetical protein GCM10012275_35260 [Longimycelium tulufanense]|uniref:Uncharacterized protein n=1 Tax=Longimycelium tulufanense TaxID=907463 RepID=A0A8J3CE53_9PSEU|nr:hypothetical protein [Longimycelium tulufanense]GGM61140.1 hypothetical protein GCM10012275_35260 [Longimycelium tulufanense]